MVDSPLSLRPFHHPKVMYSSFSHRPKAMFQTSSRDPSAEEESLVQHTMNAEHSANESTAKRTKSGSQIGKKKREKLKRGVSWRHSSRSRRLIANARERSRIHIMSDAFDCLRRAVPSYSHDQKLSKLAILRLATSYISALAHLKHLAENDSDNSLKLFADCVDECTRALQTEGRTKRKETTRKTSLDGSPLDITKAETS